MEDILVHYVEIELKFLSEQISTNKIFTKKVAHKIYKKINRILYIHLLGREDHILHVLIKIKYEISTEISIFLNFIYG